MQPTISIIIPIYNARFTLEKAVGSVLAQTFQDWELLLIDDCSTDGSDEMGAHFSSEDKRISFIRLGKNSGLPAVPRNRGLDLVRGKYVAFLDADDVWHLSKLSEQLRVIESGGYDFVSTGLVNFREELPLQSSSCINLVKVSLLDQLIKYRTPMSSWLCKKDVFNHLRFDENYANQGREDVVFSLQMHAQFGDSIKINSPLVFYRVHSNQLSKNKIRMIFKLFRAILTTDLGRKNWIKIFFPFFCLTNLFFSIYWRVVRGVL